MDLERFRYLLNEFKSGAVSENELLTFLKNLPYEDIDFAKIDHHRGLRWGFPEVIYCENKTPAQAAEIARRITESGGNLLATRAGANVFAAVKELLPEAEYNERARTIVHRTSDIQKLPGAVLVVTAGTADIPVAEEAVVTGTMLGLSMESLTDIGVAGIHRVFRNRHRLDSAAVIIVVAGMEGALPSVIGGLVSVPIIAVPTSVGYGTSFGGITPLLGMLNSCVPGIAVMNVDNGFGAAFLAFRIIKSIVASKKDHA